MPESKNNGPKPLEHLLGCANEAGVKVEVVEMTALVRHWVANLYPH